MTMNIISSFFQNAVIRGTLLGMELMKDGVIINMSSVGGKKNARFIQISSKSRPYLFIVSSHAPLVSQLKAVSFSPL